ncbi:MAG: SRPBCC family protein [Gammaproteobacteria bacterium]
MRIVKKIAAYGLIILAILVLMGLALPESVQLERSITIQRPAATIYNTLIDLSTFNSWSPWARRDPNIQYRFEGPSHGTGARLSWRSDNPEVGSGTQEIISSEKDRHITIALTFDDEANANSFFHIQPVENGCKVIWGFDTRFGYNIVARYFGLMIADWVGKDYESGLGNLKSLLENQTEQTAE